MKNNIHKKYTEEDKFARRFCCQRARRSHVRMDKKRQKKQFRRVSF